MFHSTYDPQVVYYAARVKVFRPDERDPDWVIRAAEHERVIRQMRAERKAETHRGFVARVRMAFSRA